MKQEYFDIAFYYLNFFKWALFSAFFVYLFDFSMQSSGRILTWYKIFLLENALNAGDPESLKKLKNELPRRVNNQLYISKLEQLASQYVFWQKAAGLCAICFGVYVALIVFFCAGLQSYFVGHGWFGYTQPIWFAVTTNFLIRKINA